MSSGIPQEKRAALWAQFMAGVSAHPDCMTAEQAAHAADDMLAEYEKRNQVIETFGGTDLHFGLPQPARGVVGAANHDDTGAQDA